MNPETAFRKENGMFTVIPKIQSSMVDFLIDYGFNQISFSPPVRCPARIDVFAEGRKVGFLQEGLFNLETDAETSFTSLDMLEDVAMKPFLSRKNKVIGVVKRVGISQQNGYTTALIKLFGTATSLNLSEKQLQYCAKESLFNLVQFIPKD